MPDLSIGDIAGSAWNPTLRRSDSTKWFGLLPSPTPRISDCRLTLPYPDRIAIVHFGKRVGSSLAELKILLNGGRLPRPPPERWRNLAHERVSPIRPLISEAIRRPTLLFGDARSKMPKTCGRGVSLDSRECRPAAAMKPSEIGAFKTQMRLHAHAMYFRSL